MRRSEIKEATDEIIKALDESNLAEAISKIPPATKESSEWSIVPLSALKDYSVKASSFSPAAVKLTSILNIAYLVNPQTWVRLFSGEPTRSRLMTARIFQDIKFVKEHLPQIAELVLPESLRIVDKNADESDSKYKDKDIFSLIIIEENNRLSSPERLIEALESVSKLYYACATMLGLSPEGLSVIACDSGSDKSFDFLGTAKVIECLKEFILSMWDRVVYYREKQLEQRIELVNKSLPVYDRLAELVKEKKLEPEMGEILRRNIFEGTSKFIKAGVTIPEIDRVSLQPPRVLMSPEPKLLVSAPNDILTEEKNALHTTEASTKGLKVSRSEDKSKINLKGLSDEEQVLLGELLKKVQQGEEEGASEINDSENDIEEPS